MKAQVAGLPKTGQVLRFLVKCFGEVLGKGVRKPNEAHGGAESNAAQYKRIERLAKQGQQRKGISRELENALIDAVAALFNIKISEEAVSEKIRGMAPHERIQFALLPFNSENESMSQFALGLVFWIVYLIEHHEWLCPQLEIAHSSNDALWHWVEHMTHLYTNAVANSVGADPSLLAGLPEDLSWNVPVRQPDGTVKWPICHAIDWFEGLLDAPSQEKLPSLLFPNPRKSHSIKYFKRLKRGDHLPSLENINRWSAYPWRFKEASTLINRERLKVVLLWCRGLQFALRKVEKRFGIDSVFSLVDWHNQAVASRKIKLSAPPILSQRML